MSNESDSRIPRELRPREADFEYDLESALASVVAVQSRVPDDAFTASVLGTERAGHGVVVETAGLVLTIGYLVTEAEQVWLLDAAGRAVAGDVLAYDYETGFGLVQALGPLAAEPRELGSVESLAIGDTVLFAGYGGRTQALRARVAAIAEFAGYWEYVLDNALFTAPPHPNWGGAAVFDAEGRVCAVGSLYTDHIFPRGEPVEGNMSVPVDLLKPILPELLRYGRRLRPARPWLGVFVSELEDNLVVAGVYTRAPAAAALRTGDVILSVGGHPVSDLAGLFRTIWRCGEAGVDIPLTIEREQQVREVRIHSVDRRDFWHKPALH